MSNSSYEEFVKLFEEDFMKIINNMKGRDEKSNLTSSCMFIMGFLRNFGDKYSQKQALEIIYKIVKKRLEEK